MILFYLYLLNFLHIFTFYHFFLLCVCFILVSLATHCDERAMEWYGRWYATSRLVSARPQPVLFFLLLLLLLCRIFSIENDKQ